MRATFFNALAAALAVSSAPAGLAAVPGAGIIPAPVKCEWLPGGFTIDATVKVFCCEGGESEAHFLQAGLKARTGFELEITGLEKRERQGISLELVTAGTNSPEAYTLEISPQAMCLRAGSTAGLFYGVQSLLQMVSSQAATSAPLWLPAVRITDQPRFGWRGFMLDESRHFFGKETVLGLLDTMAYLKLNRFHWHLTDEPGWRLEIKEYPDLAKIGGRGNWSDPNAPASFYTQADIREIVEYARQRHIMIVPELDMPGHATAATRAYPEISGGGTGPWAGFTFNPARERTYEVLGNVLQEAAALFPGPYLHIGGDEVHYGNQSWSADPAIVKFTENHGMTNVDQLEQYFVRRMAGVVSRLGKTTVGWDEIGGAGLPPSQTLVMWWRHDQTEVLQSLLANDYRVVLCPRLPCYFDFVQAEGQPTGRRWQERFNRLSDVYSFPESTLAGLVPADREANVMGIEACAWTEQIQNSARLAFMIYPRLAALAEAAWTPPAVKSFGGFEERVPGFLRELDRRRLPYYNPFEPAQTPEPAGPGKRVTGTASG